MCPSTYVSGQVHSQRSGRGEAYLQSVDKSYCSGSDAAAEMGPSAHGHYSGHCGTHWKHQGRFWCLSYITKETFRGLSLVCKVSIKELVNVPAPRCEEEGFLPSPLAPRPLLGVRVAFCTTPLPFLGCSSTFCCILLLGKVGEFGLCSKTVSPCRQEMNPLLAF